MKKFYRLFIFTAVVAFASCGDSENVADFDWFGTPQITDITSSTAGVECPTGAADGVMTPQNAGFSYAAVDESGKTGPFADTPALSADGGRIRAQLSGLQPGTTYRIHAYMSLGSSRITSADATFSTENGLPDETVLEITSLTTLAVAAEGDICTVSYRIINPAEDSSVRAESSEAWVNSFDCSVAGEVSFAVDANTGAERTAAVTISCPSAAPRTVTVVQSAAADTPVSGDVYRTGWAELPTEVSNPDYYYAHHLCPDFTIGGHKARNYTVCFSAEHHCPVWVAAPRHSCYEGGASRTDAYGKDPDIPSGIQYKSKSTGGGCNKGHMLGSHERTRSSAINRQVFYYTNIAPQYSSGFNTGGGGWNTLEDWIDGKVCSDTTYLVIGTYFEQYTDGYGKSASPKRIEFGGRSDVSCPTMFYIAVLRTKRGNTGKSVMNCSKDELMCAAFVRAHNNSLKGQSVTSREMMSVADLERLTGFTFFANVPNAPKESCRPGEWGL